MFHRNDHKTASLDHVEVAEETVPRKTFLTVLGACMWIGSMSLALIGSLRAVFPSVLPDPSARLKIGRLSDFMIGVATTYEEEDLTVFRDDQGIFAISTLCTHLGCVVRRSEEGFQCPCHGSRYTIDGVVTQGPAPKPLSWYAIEKTPAGHLVVDRSKPVKIGTKYSFDGDYA